MSFCFYLFLSVSTPFFLGGGERKRAFFSFEAFFSSFAGISGIENCLLFPAATIILFPPRDPFFERMTIFWLVFFSFRGEGIAVFEEAIPFLFRETFFFLRDAGDLPLEPL